MDHKTYMKVTTGIFAVVALLHAARLLFGWDAVIGGWQVPAWLSLVALAGAGFLTYTGYKFQR